MQHALEGLDLQLCAGEAVYDAADFFLLARKVLAHGGGELGLLPGGLGAVGATEEDGLAQGTHALQTLEVAPRQHRGRGARQVGQVVEGAGGIGVDFHVINVGGNRGQRTVKIRNHGELFCRGQGLNGGRKRHGIPCYAPETSLMEGESTSSVSSSRMSWLLLFTV